ncbi:hypothetical protein, partial [uncultured Acidaminococcus sp.]|uniref:hypothetical protein n=1 Tax=uncultured Acidaminococcus sp. TaxID=352152 RepID=UPI0029424E8E
TGESKMLHLEVTSYYLRRRCLTNDNNGVLRLFPGTGEHQQTVHLTFRPPFVRPYGIATEHWIFTVPALHSALVFRHWFFGT